MQNRNANRNAKPRPSMQNRDGTTDRSVEVREVTGRNPDDISESLASLFAN